MEGNLSKFEIDFYRLLVRCETLASEDVSVLKPWRVKANINALRSQFDFLKKKPTSLNLRECGRRLEDLQSSFQDFQADNAPSSPEIMLPGKLLSSQMVDQETSDKDRKYKTHMEQEIRQRLLHPSGLSVNNSSSATSQLTQEDVDRMVEQHRKLQEHQVDQLERLVRDLKESANDANQMVRKDNKTLEETNQHASQNMDDLTKQKKRLDEAVSRSGTLWLWLLIGMVVAAFIGMIVFMKVFRKRL